MDTKKYAGIVALLVMAGFAGGVVSAKLVTPLDVHAQASPKIVPVQRAPGAPPLVKQLPPPLGEQVITVPATPGGLAFKTPDGRILARLRANKGGEFTIFNDDGTAVATLGAAGGGGSLSVASGDGQRVVGIDDHVGLQLQHRKRSVVRLNFGDFGGLLTLVKYGDVRVGEGASRTRGVIEILDGRNQGVLMWRTP